MKWADSVHERLRTPLLLSVILLVVLASNFWERRNIHDLDASFSSIYDDRLVPATYIFKLTDHLYKKRLLWSEAGKPERVEAVRAELKRHDAEIADLVRGFEFTYMVDAESQALRGFKARVAACQGLEQRWITGTSDELRVAMTGEFDAALEELNQLSRIQEQVGKDLKKGSQSLLASSDLLYQLELSLLIVVGLLILSLVFVSKSLQQPGSDDARSK